MLRHRIKRDYKDRNRCRVLSAKEEGVSRLDKIEALQYFGYGIGRKANCDRVERALERACEDAEAALERAEAIRVARNRRKRERRRRAA